MERGQRRLGEGPMATVLYRLRICDDKDMQSRAKKYMDAILSRQQEDGWICPARLKTLGYDMWALI